MIFAHVASRKTIRRVMRMLRMTTACRAHETFGFVEDGELRLLAAIEAEVRPDIETKFAGQWQEAGLLERWFLLKQIDREVAEAVKERSKHLSPYSLY